MAEKNFIKRSCDSPTCDTVEIIPQGEALTGTTAHQLSHWIAVQTHEAEFVRPPNAPPDSLNGQWVVKPVLKLACRGLCAINIIKTGSSVEGTDKVAAPTPTAAPTTEKPNGGEVPTGGTSQPGA